MVTNLSKVINEKIPELSPGLQFTVLSVPNPHLISIVSKEILLSDNLEELAVSVNDNHPLFPDGVNVSFIYPLSSSEIFVRTFERGVGFTNACGTGMSASSIAVILNGLHSFEEPLTVFNPGGNVKTITHNDKGRLWVDLVGNATYSFRGEILYIKNDEFIWGKTESYDEEVKYVLLEERVREKMAVLNAL